VFRDLTCKRIQVDEIWAFVSPLPGSPPAYAAMLECRVPYACGKVPAKFTRIRQLIYCLDSVQLRCRTRGLS
jgi:hypothetical protein